jgi:hypothetical protein
VLDEPRAGRVAEGRPAAHGLDDRRAECRRGRLRGDDPVDAVGDELGRSVLRARHDDARRAARRSLDDDEAVALALGRGRDA